MMTPVSQETGPPGNPARFSGRYRAEFRIVRPDGSERWLLGVGEGVLGPDQTLRVVGYNADITEQKRAEVALREALEAKELLLGEVNHRVKNSLQLVASLLSLSTMQIADPAARTVLKDACQRVAVVSQVHQRLYQTGAHSTVDLCDYLRGLCADTAAALEPGALATVTFEGTAATPVQVDRGVAVALVVSELLTNALKHACRGDRPCTIRVSMARRSDGRAVVSVCDDGVGLPDGFTPTRATGLGFRIITALVRQVGAQLDVHRLAPGSRFAIVLPEGV